MQAEQALVPVATHGWCLFCASSCWSGTPQRLLKVKGQVEQARKSSCIVLGLGRRGMVGPSKGAAAPG